jgi:hypothetical protein
VNHAEENVKTLVTCLDILNCAILRSMEDVMKFEYTVREVETGKLNASQMTERNARNLVSELNLRAGWMKFKAVYEPEQGREMYLAAYVQECVDSI